MAAVRVEIFPVDARVAFGGPGEDFFGSFVANALQHGVGQGTSLSFGEGVVSNVSGAEFGNGTNSESAARSDGAVRLKGGDLKQFVASRAAIEVGAVDGFSGWHLRKWIQ